MRKNDWYHVSSHGALLFCIAARPGCTMNDLAEAMSLTRRRVQGIIGDLRRADMPQVRKAGRRHRYAVNPDAPFQHPAIKGYTLRAVLGGLIEQTPQR